MLTSLNKRTKNNRQSVRSKHCSTGSDWSIINMIINLWYNKDMDQWRWTLTDPLTMDQHAGNQSNLRTAMNDVANTVEHIVKSK